MVYNEQQIGKLRNEVGNRLGEKRFSHTLGVERAAVKIGEKILPDKVSLLSVAALLHDITKEYSAKEHIDIMNKHLRFVSESDILAPSVYHSLTAPFVISKEFPEFSTDEVLSAVLNHTVGAPDMTLFDEIIFVSDYVEEGREYISCVEVREKLMAVIDSDADREECISALHDATIAALDNTIISVIKRGGYLHEKTVMTRNAFLGRRPAMLK